MVTALVATIIHMQYGFEMPEALWRGIASALIVWAVIFVGYFIFVLIASAVSGLRGR